MTAPAIRFKGFNEEWEKKKLEEIGTVQMCKRIMKNETSSNGEIPFFKIGTFGKLPDAYISRVRFEEYRNKFSYPKKGEILLSAAGTLGRAVIYNGEDAYYQDSNIVWLSHDETTIINKYLYQYYAIIKWVSSEGSTIARLYNDNIKKTVVVVPSLAEQKKIADCLSSLDRLISLQDKKVTRLKELKKGLSQKIFSRQLRFKADDGSEYPEWEEKKLGNVLEILRGGSPRPIDKYMTNGVGINWIKIGDAPIYGNRITAAKEKIIFEGAKHSRKAYKGDLILSNSMSFGRPYILEIDGCIHDGWLLIRDSYNYFNLAFLCEILSSDTVLSQYKRLAAGSAVNNLNKDLVAKVRVSIPCLPEQQKIAAFLSSTDNLIRAAEKKLASLKEIKKGLMQKMFI